MTQFKKGDKVKRVASSHNGMVVGDTAIVRYQEGDSYLYLEGYEFSHDPVNFELVKDEKENISKFLKENKWFIRTGSLEKSELVQEWLFEHGVGWAGNPKETFDIYGTQHKMLTNTSGGQATGTIMWSVDNDFTASIAQEIKLEFETIIKNVRLPEITPKKTEQQLRIEELEATIAQASAQIKQLKEGV